MQIKPRSYPHPVLSHFSDDVVGAQFQTTVAVTGTKTAYVFDIVAKTSSRDLVTLIEARKAQYAIHVECALTRYRQLFASGDERFQFEIPSTEIDGRVEVCSLILALEDLPAYSNRNFHKDYQGLLFAVRKGDTLAVAADQVFIAEKKTDPLRRIPSIFVIVPNEAENAPAMEIDTTGPKISVSLSKPNYDAYNFLRQAQHLRSTLNSMIIVPALVAVLEDVKRAAASADGLVDFESRRWFSTLSRRLREMGIDPTDYDSFTESSPALAHRLIGEPLADSLKNLRSYEENSDSEALDD